MSKVDALQFEVERRAIQLKYNTNMPDETTLGYDGDPNSVVNGNTLGETLLYNVALGATFFQSDGTWWQKKALPNTWYEIGGTGSTTGQVISKIISPSNTETFYVLDLSNNQGFDFTVLSTMGTVRERSKIDAMYNPDTDEMLFNTYSYLVKEPLDLNVNIYSGGGNCTLEITNNELSDVTCEVQLMTFYEA
jgi:hypothetical protein